MIQGSEDATDNGIIEKYCYDDDPANCDTYGGLYQWNETMQYITPDSTTPGVQGICPPGWHIPTLDEFTTLSDAVGGDGNALKEIGQGTGGGAGTNTSGFSALLAGTRFNNGYFNRIGNNAFFWGSTEYYSGGANDLYFYGDGSYIYFGYGYKEDGFSVRCVKD
ncbi:fibrobacter succinogenes major domain (Fib_succ_major) [bacterium BMS3Abin03]|nr:fibrobacter succinogenes major domain (Fib_succ_major) [bacterium BMS3Abin03]